MESNDSQQRNSQTGKRLTQMKIKIHKQRKVAKLSLRLVEFCLRAPRQPTKRPHGNCRDPLHIRLMKPQAVRARKVAAKLKAQLAKVTTTRQVMAEHLNSMLGE